MTLAPFALVEQATNAAVQAMLANATATHNGGTPFGVLFDRAPADPFGGAVDAAACAAAFCLANAPGLAKNDELVINSTAYIVASGVQPNASDWISLTVYPKN